MVFRKRKTNPALETGGTKRSRSKRLVAIVIFILLVVIVAGAVLYEKEVKNDNPKETYTTNACAALYGDMRTAIDAQDYQKYKELVDKVVAVPGYDKDQNCLYPLVDYYSTTGNATQSREYYDKLALAYDQKGFSGDIAGGTKTIVVLETQVKASEAQLEAYKKGPTINDFKRH